MEKVFFSGINGIGMSGLALILKNLGYTVAGSDIAEKGITKTLRDNGIEVFIEQKLENVENKGYDTYVYSTAIKENNPEYSYMKEKGVTMYRRGALLAEIMNKFKKGIAVAGTHGKTTTSSLLSVVFLDKDPYIAVGGIIPEIDSNSKVGNSEYFIAEADESDNTFLYMNPYYSVITNVEADHLDFHGTLEHIIESFKKFVDLTKHKVLACFDNDILKTFKDEKIIYYSVDEKNKENVDVYASNIQVIDGITSFDVYILGEFEGRYSLSVPGLHNVSNSLPVIYIALKEGISRTVIQDRLLSFKGANSRYQVLYENEFKIIDDYAHHPTEILATIKAAKMNEKKEVNVIFEPHRYSRTSFFLDDFANSLREADNIYLLPIYSASEENIYDISSEKLAKEIGNHCTVYTKEEVIEKLLEEDKKDKVYIFMGAGSVSALAHNFVERINDDNRK